MRNWIEDPFKSVLFGTGLVFVVCGALASGMSLIDLFV